MSLYERFGRSLELFWFSQGVYGLICRWRRRASCVEAGKLTELKQHQPCRQKDDMCHHRPGVMHHSAGLGTKVASNKLSFGTVSLRLNRAYGSALLGPSRGKYLGTRPPRRCDVTPCS